MQHYWIAGLFVSKPICHNACQKYHDIIFLIYCPPLQQSDGEKYYHNKYFITLIIIIWCSLKKNCRLILICLFRVFSRSHAFGLLAHATSGCSITQSEESAIRPLLHAWTHRCLWLAWVTVIDSRETLCHPSLPESIALLSFWPSMTVASSRFELVISGW